MKPRVKFKLKGYNLDQVLSKIQSKNIECYNIVRTSISELEFSVSIRNFKLVKQLVANYEHTTKFLGLSNFRHWIMRNVVIVAMIPIIVGLAVFSTRFVWNVRIYGVGEAMQAEIIEVLRENDISVGKSMPKSNLEIEKLLLTELPNVAQVSCIKRGTTIIINVSEKLVYTPKEYQPITANYDGVVESFNLISGTMAVNIGDFVAKGDVLVYPFTLDKDGNQVTVRPIAEVKAKAYIVGQCSQSATTLELVRTGKTHTISSIRIWNKNLFSKNEAKPFDICEVSVYNKNISSVLPIVKSTITYYEQAYTVVNHDLHAEQDFCEQESKLRAYEQLPSNIDILDEQTSSLIIGDNLYCTTTLTVVTIIS